jgi:4-amino-4-deoxy-L-arabinose transferase-like glycosyltransferase
MNGISNPSPLETPVKALLPRFLLPVFIVMLFFPLMTDEAYYITWAQKADWPKFGFFDHPPFVSWQAFATRFWHHLIGARFFVFITAILTLYINYKTALRIIADKNKALLASLVSFCTLAGIVNAVVLTPDSGLALFWSLAIHESLVAIQTDRRRWITAGIATGMGLLSKYTMVLIGPVFLFALIVEAREQLRSKWPYLGGLAALMVFLPNILWNINHDYVTFKFQFGHGFSSKQNLSISSTLPPAKPTLEDSQAFLAYKDLQNTMNGVPGFEETKSKPRVERSKLEIAWQRIGDYLGGVIGLWGAFLIFFMIRYFKVRNSNALNRDRPRGYYLLVAASIFPILFFAILSPFSKVEANWPAMHMSTAAILMTLILNPSTRVVARIASIHFAIVFALLGSLYFVNYLPDLKNNRLVVESKGYDDLVNLLSSKVSSEIIAVDNYQLKSAFAIRKPSIQTVQWPGITRPSEYTRADFDEQLLERKILEQSGFQLLTYVDLPPTIDNYEVTDLKGIRACPDGQIAFYSIDYPILPCNRGIRDWWLVQYQKMKPNEGL